MNRMRGQALTKTMTPIRIAIAGVGNCASSLLQGLSYYAQARSKTNGLATAGLLNPKIGGYAPGDIKIVAAFDIDERKVSKSLEEACMSDPNCTTRFLKKFPKYGVNVHMGPILDGIAPHMKQFPREKTFVPSSQKAANVAQVLKKTGAEILLSYLPVGSQKATEAYVEACLETGVSIINCIPVFIASEPAWAEKFAKRGIPLIGDDVKGQVGATILHRTLARLFLERGAVVDRTYQLNVGGNTDFLNMLSRDRLASKKISKTEAVQSALGKRLEDQEIHVGPSDYVPWQRDRKVCFLRLEGRGFGDCPIEIEARLSVEDSPNSAGMTIDAIRSLRLARERRLSGPILSVSAWTMKHPPKPMTDEEARQRVEAFISGDSDT